MTAPIHPAIDGAGRGVLPSAPMVPAPRVIHRYEIVPDPVRWVLPEGTVPESKPHANESSRFEQYFRRWAELAGRRVLVGRNQGVRWDREHPQYGVDPDVFIVEPPPPEGEELRSLRLWEPGHVAPLLAVEIVSAGHPWKDYVQAPVKYAACGVGELWILDRNLEGPRVSEGPHRIQVWRRRSENEFARVYAGEGPAWSEAVQGWIRFWPEERSFGLSSDKAGRDRWLTNEEAAQREAKAERKAREAAEDRIRELEAQLARAR